MSTTSESYTIHRNTIISSGQKLIENIIIQSGGIIFGGYVRDKLYKEYQIKKFYENIGISPEEDQDYSKLNNENLNVESIGRLLNPNDIDVFFKSEEELKKFEKIITQKFNVIVSNHTGSEYEIFLGYNQSLHHKVIFINFDNLGLFSYISLIKLDIIYPKQGEIYKLFHPCQVVDLYSNALYLDENGIHLSQSIENNIIDKIKREILKIEIIQGIYEKKTKFNSQIFNYNCQDECKTDLISLKKKVLNRLIDFIERGWEIENQYFEILLIKIESPSNLELNKCVICLREFEENCKVAKLKCCKAEMHFHCLKKYLFHQFEECEIPKCIHRCDQSDKKNYFFLWE